MALESAEARDGTVQQTPDLWCCEQCGRGFDDLQSLELHTRMHAAGESFTQAEILLRRDLLYEEVRRQEDEASGRQALPEKPPSKPRRIYKPHSKRVGLTKIRLEDCLRCDACSCIYIDEQDYYKHMRNFHQKYNTVIPRARKKSPLHHKCYITYTEVHPQEPANMEKQDTKPASIQPVDTFFKEKIKNQWSKVSQKLSNPVTIKQEPIDDMDYLLSQVEVKIKTEPPEI